MPQPYKWVVVFLEHTNKYTLSGFIKVYSIPHKDYIWEADGKTLIFDTMAGVCDAMCERLAVTNRHSV